MGSALAAVLVGFSVLLCLPLAAAQPGKVFRIGFLSGAAGPLPNHQGFHQGLREAGYIEGQNLTIEYRWAAGRHERYQEMAADLVRRQVDVIFAAGGSAPTRVLREATSTIPIVTVMGDIVGDGFAASHARPGGNVTGLSMVLPELSGKQLQLLREILPGLGRVATLHNPAASPRMLEETRAAAGTLGLDLQVVLAPSAHELDKAFGAIAAGGAEAVLVQADPLFNAQRARIAELAIRYRLPVIFTDRIYPDAGGFLSYGPSLNDLFRRAAHYVARILKGARPADLPIERPVKFELVINLKTARAIGLTIPPAVLLRADEVID